MPDNFGIHQTLDVYYCNPKKLNSEETVRSFLQFLPDKISMKKIIKPVTKRCPAVSEKDGGGISGFVMIATSHISIHTFPDRGYASIDVYSCNAFDTEMVKNYVKHIFDAQRFEENIIIRGQEFEAHARLLKTRMSILN